jgi:hypothetical protein
VPFRGPVKKEVDALATKATTGIGRRDREAVSRALGKIRENLGSEASAIAMRSTETGRVGQGSERFRNSLVLASAG